MNLPHHGHEQRKIKKPKKDLMNGALKYLLFISGIFMFAFAMFSPIYAIFVEQVGGGIEVAANSWAIFGAVAGLLTFLFSHYENEMHETELAIAWSQFVVGLGYVLLCFTDNVTVLYIDMVILGVGEALYWPAFHSVFAKHTDGKKSTAQWGIYDGLAYFVPAIGSAIGGWFVASYGFNFIFTIMAIMSFFCGIFIILLPRKAL